MNKQLATFKPATAKTLVDIANAELLRPKAAWGSGDRRAGGNAVGNAVGAWVVQAMAAIDPAIYSESNCGEMDWSWCRILYRSGDYYLPYQPDGNDVLLKVYNPTTETVPVSSFLLAVRELSGTIVVAEIYGVCSLDTGTGSTGTGSTGTGETGTGETGTGETGTGSTGTGETGTGETGTGETGTGETGTGETGTGETGTGETGTGGTGSDCAFTGFIELTEFGADPLIPCHISWSNTILHFVDGILCYTSPGDAGTLDLESDCCCDGTGTGGGGGGGGGGGTGSGTSQQP